MTIEIRSGNMEPIQVESCKSVYAFLPNSQEVQLASLSEGFVYFVGKGDTKGKGVKNGEVLQLSDGAFAVGTKEIKETEE